MRSAPPPRAPPRARACGRLAPLSRHRRRDDPHRPGRAHAVLARLLSHSRARARRGAAARPAGLPRLASRGPL
jgi:hypothetical protein